MLANSGISKLAAVQRNWPAKINSEITILAVTVFTSDKKVYAK